MGWEGRQGAKRRGAQVQPPNRFERIHVAPDGEAPADFDSAANSLRVIPTEYFYDATRSILSENDSLDVPFRFSLNPYRGCVHGCTYCYARPYHEMLGWSAGLDFETKIMVKPEAPALLREFLSNPKWECEPIALSGVTDCYQPIERQFRLTRQCLEVCLEHRQPVMIVTKGALVLRDVDLLADLAQRRLAKVAICVTSLERDLVRAMEPRAANPERRLEIIGALSAAGVPVSVLMAPVIPGLNDVEIPRILEAAREAGATAASYVLLRLPGAVQEVFFDWLDRVFPEKRKRVETWIRETRGGALNASGFATRMQGAGPLAEQIRAMFRLFRERNGLAPQLGDLDCSQFCRPGKREQQLELF